MNGTEQAPRKNAKSDNGRVRKPIDKKKSGRSIFLSKEK